MKINKYLSILMKLLKVSIKSGKKNKSFSTILLMLKNLKKKSSAKNITTKILLTQAFNNICPALDTLKITKKKKVYYLPQLITAEKELNMGMSWFLESVANRKEKKLHERLTNEILDCYNGVGSTITKKQNYYALIIKGRPFLHFLKY